MKREFFGSGGRPGISSVMVDAFNIMQDRITRARLAGDPPDLLISPRVGEIGWFDFHRADDLIAHGARAAERAIEFDPGSDPHSRAGCRASRPRQSTKHALTATGSRLKSDDQAVLM